MPYTLWKGRQYKITKYRIIDGDTIDAEIKEEYEPRETHRIRLHGIDAPEIEQPYGPEAAQYLYNAIRTTRRTFLYVTEESDRYGRTVGILHSGNIKDPINARIVRAGLAFAEYSYDYQDEEQAARNARAGVGQQRGGGERPRDFRARGRRPPSKNEGFLKGCFTIIIIIVILMALNSLIGSC